MSQSMYGSYEENKVSGKENTSEEEVYYEDDLEKKHLYKEIEFAVDRRFWFIRFYGTLSCYY